MEPGTNERCRRIDHITDQLLENFLEAAPNEMAKLAQRFATRLLDQLQSNTMDIALYDLLAARLNLADGQTDGNTSEDSDDDTTGSDTASQGSNRKTALLRPANYGKFPIEDEDITMDDLQYSQTEPESSSHSSCIITRQDEVPAPQSKDFYLSVPAFVRSIGDDHWLDQLRTMYPTRSNAIQGLKGNQPSPSETLKAIQVLDKATPGRAIQRRFYLKALAKQYESLKETLDRSQVIECLADPSQKDSSDPKRITNRLQFGKKWLRFDDTFGLGTFAVVPAGRNAVFSSSSIERLNEADFRYLMKEAESRASEIRQKSKMAAVILGLVE